MDAKIVDSLRSAMDGLKHAVESGNAEMEAKWQARFDELEFGMKKVSEKSEPTEGAETKLFIESAMKFGQGVVDSEMKGAKVTSSHGMKADNLVRFDLAQAGALLLPAEMSANINRQIVEISPVLQVANVVNTSAPSYKQALRNDSLAASWLEENTSATKVRDSFGYKDIPAHKLAARVAWTIEQAQDSAYDLEAEINLSIREQFDRAIGSAFISGDGVKKPTGLVGNVTAVSGATITPQALTADALIAFQQSIKTAYQRNASWMMNRATLAKVRRLTVTGGTLAYIWEPNFQAGMPSRLLGSPVYEAPDLAGTSAVFGTGQVPILYGDFRYGYTVVRNTDFFLIRDPYTEGNAFVTNLYAMTRIGGDVVRSEAICSYVSV
jgi:HK97 family phage major capsid protein